MLDWRFNDFECLPLLISLLLNKEASKDESSLDNLYDSDKEKLLSDLRKSKENNQLFELILSSLKNGSLITDKKYSSRELSISNFHNISVEPVSFFRWAEKEGYSYTYNVKNNVVQREAELRVRSYKDYKISKDEVAELMREPLWFVYDAVLYLHGYKPILFDALSYLNRNPNLSIIKSDSGMKKIYEYLLDANKLGDIRFFDRSEHKVRPNDFMVWAESLKLSFPNLVISKEKGQKSLGNRERDTLLKLIIGMAIKGYGYNPAASKNTSIKEIADDLDSLGISLDVDTVRKWIKEAADTLPRDVS